MMKQQSNRLIWKVKIHSQFGTNVGPVSVSPHLYSSTVTQEDYKIFTLGGIINSIIAVIL